MSRNQTAFYCLLASAFVLAGLLIVTVQDRFATEADASVVIADQGITFLTAQTRSGDESLFVLSNATGILNIYSTDVGKGRLELRGSRNIAQLLGR